MVRPQGNHRPHEGDAGDPDAEIKALREVTWTRHSQERDDLDERTGAAVDHVRDHMKEQFRPQWRDLYRGQKKEERQVQRLDGMFSIAPCSFIRTVSGSGWRERL